MASPIERKFLAQPQSGSAGRVLASPFQFFTTGEEALRVTSACSVAGALVAVHYRFLDPERGIIANRETHNPNSDRTTRSTEFALGAGALLNLSVFAETGAPRLGQCFVRVQLIRGRGDAAVVMGTLVQGYVTGNQDLAWPGSPLQYSTDGPGVIRAVLGTDPTAGSELGELVPTGATWELLALSAALVTDATVGDRIARLQVTGVGFCHLRAPANPPIPPSTAAQVCWFADAQYQTAFDAGAVVGPIPSRLILPAGTILFTWGTIGAAGDDWGRPLLLVREWLDVD